MASSACHSEQSSLLKAALLPLPSKSLAAQKGLHNAGQPKRICAGVASSACHSEQSSLLKAALLPQPSRSLAAQKGFHNAEQPKRICAGVASSACHSEQSSLLKAALLPLPSRSLAAHFLLEPQDSLFYWLPTRLEREPKVKDLKTHSTNIESADYG
ncbi:MAG: hypothetical protein PHH38_02515 [Candidatus Cloacimonetes bacterium]|nr:hypothetical protein [Candidatus Cloacimonadota bacterium]